jgi:hypothetical protein
LPFFKNLTLYKILKLRSYIVAAPYHWRANTYDSTIAYLANRL